MRFDELNENNYLLFAIKFYNNPNALTKEDFEDDLKRIKYIKRLLKRYNVFDDAAVPLLFYNLEEDLWPSIKSFLLFLDRIPEYPKSHIHGIPEDPICIEELNSV